MELNDSSKSIKNTQELILMKKYSSEQKYQEQF